MSDKIYLEPDQLYCIIPAELVTGEVTLCAGVKFQQVDADRAELILLTEANVDALTSPEPA